VINVKSKEVLDKDVYTGTNEKIGTIKELEIDWRNWQVTDLEVELDKDIAETVLGASKSGVRNLLNLSALNKGEANWTDRGLNLRVAKENLHMYLKPLKPEK
jgi:sporulation protein YlmC with PRC-barrel domain